MMVVPPLIIVIISVALCGAILGVLGVLATLTTLLVTGLPRQKILKGAYQVIGGAQVEDFIYLLLRRSATDEIRGYRLPRTLFALKNRENIVVLVGGVLEVEKMGGFPYAYFHLARPEPNTDADEKK